MGECHICWWSRPSFTRGTNNWRRGQPLPVAVVGAPMFTSYRIWLFFLGSRILLDYLQSNLIISGAFGLFYKEYVIAVGGYDRQTLGEDMELVMKLHYFCRNNNIPYRICYETSAICWSQAPSSIGDLCKQRRRWFLGLYQCLKNTEKCYREFVLGRWNIFPMLTICYLNFWLRL